MPFLSAWRSSGRDLSAAAEPPKATGPDCHTWSRGPPFRRRSSARLDFPGAPGPLRKKGRRIPQESTGCQRYHGPSERASPGCGLGPAVPGRGPGRGCCAVEGGESDEPIGGPSPSDSGSSGPASCPAEGGSGRAGAAVRSAPAPRAPPPPVRPHAPSPRRSGALACLS